MIMTMSSMFVVMMFVLRMFLICVKGVIVMVVVGVVMSFVRMLRVAMVSMAKGCHANQIHKETHTTDSEELSKPLHFHTFRKSFDSFIYDLNADEPEYLLSLDYQLDQV